MDVRGGILASKIMSITQHTGILTRFAYGISCLQVTKLRLNAKCAILTDIHSERIRTLDPPSAPLKKWQTRDRMIELVRFFLYSIMHHSFHKHKTSFRHQPHNGAN